MTTEEVVFRDVSFPRGHDRDGVRVHRQPRPRRRRARGARARQLRHHRERGRARTLTFGAGVHYCVGANLARLELREALSFLARARAPIELDGEPVFESITGIYGLAELPVRFVL